MFQIKDFRVNAGDKKIIRGLDLELGEGEIHAVMGPNGAGKSSLAEALIGHPSYETEGSIKVNDEEISDLEPEERAQKGLYLAFQNPEEIEGVKITNFARKVLKSKEELDKDEDMDRIMEIHEDLVENTQKVGMPKSFAKRELNVDFSGGEKKRSEILQLLTFKPKIAILDEVDSGLDIDGIKLISDVIKELNDGERTFLIITHYPRILKYINPDYVHILANGKIVKSGDESLAHKIEEEGYSEFVDRE